MKSALPIHFLLGNPLCHHVIGAEVQSGDCWGVSLTGEAAQQHCGDYTFP